MYIHCTLCRLSVSNDLKFDAIRLVITRKFQQLPLGECRDSSVGRASDWRSEGPRFNPGSRHFFFSFSSHFLFSFSFSPLSDLTIFFSLPHFTFLHFCVLLFFFLLHLTCFLFFRDLRDVGAKKIDVYSLNKVFYFTTTSCRDIISTISVQQFHYGKISGKRNGRVRKGVIFSTYASLIGESSSGGKYRTRLNQLLHWLGQFEGVVSYLSIIVVVYVYIPELHCVCTCLHFACTCTCTYIHVGIEVLLDLVQDCIWRVPQS